MIPTVLARVPVGGSSQRCAAIRFYSARTEFGQPVAQGQHDRRACSAIWDNRRLLSVVSITSFRFNAPTLQ